MSRNIMIALALAAGVLIGAAFDGIYVVAGVGDAYAYRLNTITGTIHFCAPKEGNLDCF